MSILDAGRATLELSNPAQVRMIDRVETDGDRSDRIRLAFEVDDAAAATGALASAGATVTATPRETPWRSLNARLRAPGNLQVTLFQELDTLQERTVLEGFRTEPDAVGAVRELERVLWTADLRRDPAHRAELLAPDCTGIDERGRVLERAGIAALLAPDATTATEMRDLAETAIADDVILVTWTAVRGGLRARRSSLWRRDGGDWRLAHHQATPLT